MSQNEAPALPAQQITRPDAMVFPTVGAVDPTPVPTFKVSGIFSSHMVLQRGKPITVHGWCNRPGTVVTVSWDGETHTATPDKQGAWACTFASREASFTPTVMQISCPFGSETFTDILVGDVWVIGGQSNAELNLKPCLVKCPEIDAAITGADPFRLFSQTQTGAYDCFIHQTAPARDIIRPDWQWQRPERKYAERFSAIGYLLAKLLVPKVKVPLGMVMMCAGGACLRELVPAELCEPFREYGGANMPLAGYYNTLIAPLLGLQFTGQVFFQGESEGIWRLLALSYDKDLADMVADERQRFGVDFPFYNIQLSSYRDEGETFFPYLQWVRDRQYRALARIPNSDLIVDHDLGAEPEAPDWAHSRYKLPLAERLANLILAKQYGIGNEEDAQSPMPQTVTPCPDGVLVKFRFTQSGLTTADGKPVTGFGFAPSAAQAEGEEKIAATPARAEIVASDTVKVYYPDGVSAPQQLHYAMRNYAMAQGVNLVGGNGLPVPTFVLDL